jgi:hypothetical protein
MNFQTHNDKEIDSAYTGLVGELTLSYSDIKKTFGNPHGSDGYKSDAEWEIEFEDGVIATIYNWKNGKNYNGASGIPKTKITDWHIGGHDERAVRNIISAIGKNI